MLCSLAVTHVPSSHFHEKHSKGREDRKISSSKLELKYHQVELSFGKRHTVYLQVSSLSLHSTRKQGKPLAPSPCSMWIYAGDFKAIFLILIVSSLYGYFKLAFLSWVLFSHFFLFIGSPAQGNFLMQISKASVLVLYSLVFGSRGTTEGDSCKELLEVSTMSGRDTL